MNQKVENKGRIIQSVERAVKAMLLFLNGDDELAIKDFSERLDLPKPTIHNLVNTLTVYNLLERNPENSKYRLGPVLFRLGLHYVRQRDFISVISVSVERLCYRFRKPVNVCILMGSQVVVVSKVDPDDAVASYPNVGASVPAHRTANGKVLLAYTDQIVRERLLEGYSFKPATEFTITSRIEFDDEIKSVQKSGVGFSRQEGIADIWGIAGPIFNHTGEVIASFCVSGDVEYMQKNETILVAEVKKTAMTISRQLGYTGAF